jgi:hypothetical protein
MIGRLTVVFLNIDGVRSVANLQVIDIVDDSQPYLAPMGLEWVFYNQTSINLKKREMIFEVGYLRVTTPLDPSKGKRYIEPTRGNDIENLYSMTAQTKDYFNPIVDDAPS